MRLDIILFLVSITMLSTMAMASPVHNIVALDIFGSIASFFNNLINSIAGIFTGSTTSTTSLASTSVPLSTVPTTSMVTTTTSLSTTTISYPIFSNLSVSFSNETNGSVGGYYTGVYVPETVLGIMANVIGGVPPYVYNYTIRDKCNNTVIASHIYYNVTAIENRTSFGNEFGTSVQGIYKCAFFVNVTVTDNIGATIKQNISVSLLNGLEIKPWYWEINFTRNR